MPLLLFFLKKNTKIKEVLLCLVTKDKTDVRTSLRGGKDKI